ncbi:MAG: glycosyltransferase family 2 protein [Lachnospiraceae bacterium]|nr:glycosyltransferase family 2 protein [Lachnospiraceae bacterium]
METDIHKKNEDMKKELLIIIPAYNESKSIGALLDGLEQPEIMEIADLLIVNDASLDDTGRLAAERGHEVINNIYNLGYGSGLWVGYKYAVKHGYKYVIQMDADGQHDVCNVKRLYERLTTPGEGGVCPDIVLGSRFMEGSYPYKSSAVKSLAYALFRFLIRLGSGIKITDPTTGLQALDRRAFSFYAGYNHFDDKYPDANMIMQMLLLGFRVEEVPAVMHYRTEGVSMHSGLKPVIYMFRMVFSIAAIWIRIKLYHVDAEAAKEDEAD